MRYFRFRHRGRRFTSIHEINAALTESVRRINDRPHRRFGVSRRERFEALERGALKTLPASEFDDAEWKDATVHPDCYVVVDAAYYSAPHIHRGKRLRVKITTNQVELFLNGERLALHPRDRTRSGARVRVLGHFPPQSIAYYEVTPQRLLSQSRFVHAELHALLEELFAVDVYGNLRRVQGLLRACTKELQHYGREAAIPRILAAIEQMRQHGRVRVPLFTDLLAKARAEAPAAAARARDREIVRHKPNPLLRYVATTADGQPADPQLTLES